MSAAQRSTSKIAKNSMDTAILVSFSFRRNDNAASDDALPVDEGLVLGDVEVFQVGVGHADFLLRPVVTERLQVSIVVVLAIFFQVDNRTFLLFIVVHSCQFSSKVEKSCIFSKKAIKFSPKTCIYLILAIYLYQQNDTDMVNAIALSATETFNLLLIAQRTQATTAADFIVAGMKSQMVSELRRRMQHEVVEFYFTKNGSTQELRRAFGTTMPALAKAHVQGVRRSSKTVVTFWDTEKSAWRSARVESIVKVC